MMDFSKIYNHSFLSTRNKIAFETPIVPRVLQFFSVPRELNYYKVRYSNLFLVLKNNNGLWPLSLLFFTQMMPKPFKPLYYRLKLFKCIVYIRGDSMNGTPTASWQRLCAILLTLDLATLNFTQSIAHSLCQLAVGVPSWTPMTISIFLEIIESSLV